MSTIRSTASDRAVPPAEARGGTRRVGRCDSAGTGLTTLAVLLRRGLVEHEMLETVARRVLERGIRGGHAVFRRYRWGSRAFVHYLRWCDAHVAMGLADAATALLGQPDPAPRSSSYDSASGAS